MEESAILSEYEEDFDAISAKPAPVKTVEQSKNSPAAPPKKASEIVDEY